MLRNFFRAVQRVASHSYGPAEVALRSRGIRPNTFVMPDHSDYPHPGSRSKWEAQHRSMFKPTSSRPGVPDNDNFPHPADEHKSAFKKP
jgi:hypothetical protein